MSGFCDITIEKILKLLNSVNTSRNIVKKLVFGMY